MNQEKPILRKGTYRHYKGGHYEVIDLARHSETEEWMVIYRTLYKNESLVNNLWVRPLAMFVENVRVSGKETPRFKYVETEKI